MSEIKEKLEVARANRTTAKREPFITLKTHLTKAEGLTERKANRIIDKLTIDDFVFEGWYKDSLLGYAYIKYTVDGEQQKYWVTSLWSEKYTAIDTIADHIKKHFGTVTYPRITMKEAILRQFEDATDDMIEKFVKEISRDNIIITETGNYYYVEFPVKKDNRSVFCGIFEDKAEAEAQANALRKDVAAIQAA